MSATNGQKNPRGTTHTKKAAPKHVLEQLKATSSDIKERKADFGSIRFKGSRRPVPSKYARIAGSHAEKVNDFVRPLLFETWGLRPPSALISVLGRSSPSHSSPSPTPLDTTNVFEETKSLLVFGRGLAEAATTTNAWVVTDGLADGVAAVCGRALRESKVPLLGITPWRSIADHSLIEEKMNGQVHLYDSNNDASEPLRFCGCAKSIRSPGGFSKGTYGGDCACPQALVHLYDQHMLEGNHTHFLFVDDGVLKPRLGSEMPLRLAMERHLADAHLESGEDERMPLVFLVINGDESSSNPNPSLNPSPNPSPNPNPNPNLNHPQVGGPSIRLSAVWLFVLGSLIFFVGALIDLLVVLRAAAAERGSRRRALRMTSSMDQDARA